MALMDRSVLYEVRVHGFEVPEIAYIIDTRSGGLKPDPRSI